MMRATGFEFRNRFWMMGVIFWLGFFCYSFDQVNAGVALLRSPIPGTSTPIHAADTSATVRMPGAITPSSLVIRISGLI